MLIAAIATVHGAAGFCFTNPHGGREFLAPWIAGLVALALTSAGARALRPTTARAVVNGPTESFAL